MQRLVDQRAFQHRMTWLCRASPLAAQLHSFVWERIDIQSKLLNVIERADARSNLLSSSISALHAFGPTIFREVLLLALIVDLFVHSWSEFPLLSAYVPSLHSLT